MSTMERPLIVIQSGESKFLGLSIAEWTLALFPFVIGMTFIPSNLYPMYAFVYGVVIILYGTLISKLEQNALKTFQNNHAIPDIVKGFYCNEIPIMDDGVSVDN